jgi:class 3 adenylate cyclase
MNSEKVKKNEMRYETKALDEAITKIATLLVLGFGEAGSYIIAQNLS